jgi:predicted nucleic acid-binding protein
VIATVIDSGPILATMNVRDDHHDACARLMSTLHGRRLLPGPVLAEVCWALERRPEIESIFLHQVAAGAFELVELVPQDLRRMSELVIRYRDFPLGAVDASVLAVAERFGVERVATLDRRHFGVVRPAHVPALTLLP